MNPLSIYKLSKYIVCTPSLSKEKSTIIFSTYTGKKIILTDDFFDYLKKNKFNEIPKIFIDKLLLYGIIVPYDLDELELVVSKNEESIAQGDKNTIYIVIQPSAGCQLGCYYCGQSHSKNNLTEFNVENILSRVEKKLLDNKCVKTLTIGWFGGEPLLGLPQIRILTKGFIELANKHNIVYNAKMITNGLSLKPAIFSELTRILKIKSIEVTLDGIAKYHDKHRFTKEGRGSFSLISKNLESIFEMPTFYEHKCDISIRCNVDSANFEGVKDLIDYMYERKYFEKISNFYIAGIYSWGDNHADKLSLSKEEFSKFEIVILTHLLKLGVKSKIIPKRTEGVCLSVSATSEVIDTFGNVSNCTETPLIPNYQEQWILGNIKDNELQLNVKDKLNTWNQDLKVLDVPCNTCEMLPVCGGACPKSWHEKNIACPSAKFNIKQRLNLYELLVNKEHDEKLKSINFFLEKMVS